MNSIKHLTVGLIALTLATSAAAEWAEPDNPRNPVSPAESIQATAADPIGDTFNAGPDLTSISGETDDTTLFLTLTFAGDITPPGQIPNGQPPAGNEVVGFIELDVDQNGGTGETGGPLSIFCPQPPADFGSEFLVNLGDYDPQTQTVSLGPTAGLTNQPQGTPVRVPIAYTPNSLTVDVPNSAIGDDGIVDAATVIGNFANPTDCAPDGGTLATDRGVPQLQSVPTLSAIGLAVLFMVMLLTGLAMRRSA